MATYTDINGVKLIDTGDEAGTWGSSTNVNLQILERAANGFTQLTLTGTSSNLGDSTGSPSAADSGNFKAIEFVSSTLSTLHTITIVPADHARVYMFLNSTTGGQSVKLQQGSATTTVTIENGDGAIVFCDGSDNVTDFTAAILTGAQPNITSLGTPITLALDNSAEQIIFKNGSDNRFVFNLDSTPELDVTGDFHLDGSADILVDAQQNLTLGANLEIFLSDSGVTYGSFKDPSLDFVIQSEYANKDMIFKGSIGSTSSPTDITALTLDMDQGGTAIFNNDIKLQSDDSVLSFGADGDISFTHSEGVAYSYLTLSSAKAQETALIIDNTDTGDPVVAFSLSGTRKFTMGVDDTDSDAFKIGTTETHTNTRLKIDSSGDATFSGTVNTAGLTADNITIDGTEISLSSGDLTIKASASTGDITLNANSGDISFADDTVTFGRVSNSSSDFLIEAQVQDKSIKLGGNDGGTPITALTLDMANAGNATFNGTVTATSFSGPITGDVTGNAATASQVAVAESGNTNTDYEIVFVTGPGGGNESLFVDNATLEYNPYVETLKVPRILLEPVTSGGAGSISFEGLTADSYEITVIPTDPTSDRTVTIPDETGTIVLKDSNNDFSAGTITLSGNIVVSGTVDGRDVAADGTKLDGIEASADVTDATNVAAAGAAMLSGATFTGAVSGTSADFDGGVTVDDITIDGTEISLSSGDLIIKASASNGDITLNANGGDIVFKDDTLAFGGVQNSSGDFLIQAQGQDKSIKLGGNDGGLPLTALTLDIANAGNASFNGTVTANAGVVVDNITIDGQEIDVSSGDLTLDVSGDIILDSDGGQVFFKDNGTEKLQLNYNSSGKTIFYSGDNLDIEIYGGGTPDGTNQGDVKLYAGGDFGSILLSAQGSSGSTSSDINITASGIIDIQGDSGIRLDASIIHFSEDPSADRLELSFPSDEVHLKSETAGKDFLIRAVSSSSSTKSVAWDPDLPSWRPNADNLYNLGSGSARWAEIFAGNSTINTSDRSLKQDIESISEAEVRVAKALKGLLRKYRWISSVEEKGDAARIHFGVVAQDIQKAFEDEGLDPFKYSMLCKETYWETGVDEERVVYKTAEEAPSDAVEKVVWAVRYSELLAFIIAGL